jgi:hypothetical protein
MTNPKLTPPPELVQQWFDTATKKHSFIRQNADKSIGGWPLSLANYAAQWGADCELDACCEWLSSEALCESNTHRKLRAARRPKPPSLKEQALEALEAHFAALQAGEPTYRPSYKEVIRRALEALPDD